MNGECNLLRVGRKFREIEAGFATKSDAGTKCTSLVRDVINNHMNRMRDEGFIERAWDEHRRKTIKTIQCIDGATAGTKENVEVLSVINLGGIFLFHYSFVIIAIVAAFAIKHFSSNKYDSKEYEENEKEEAPKQLECVTADFSETMKAQFTAILDDRLSRVEDQLFQISYLLKETQKIQMNVEKNELDIKSTQICLDVVDETL